MNLTDKDMHELHEAHRDLFLPVVETARMRAMLTDAAARSAVNTAEQPEMMWRCVCGQEMRVERWQAHGCGLCGRKPVGHPEHPAPEPNAALTIEQWQRGDLSAAWAEPELTPAERTWRAHKGFSR
jgi:hypothetical protein